MLMISGMDAIRINANFHKDEWNLLTGQLIETASYNKVSWKPVSPKKNNPANGITTLIHVGGRSLQVSVLQYMKSRWISYSFNGFAPVELFDQATVLLGDYSFANALISHRVKKIELAKDFYGLHSSSFISHRRGVQSSRVISNDEETGFSQYSGSRKKSTQLVIYDKGQELIDKGKVLISPKILRVELRLQDRKGTFFDLFEEIFKLDPWNNVTIIQIDAALKLKTKIKAWPIFLSACRELGVACALQQFPQHKKSFLTMLFNPSIQASIPTMIDFEKPLINLAYQLIEIQQKSSINQ